MTDIARQEVALNPLTGEIVALPSVPLIDVARFREDMRDTIRLARDALALCEQELEARHREGLLDEAAFPVKRATSWKWDASLTHEALAQLVDDGKLGAREADALLPEVVSRKPDGRGLRSLLGRLMARDLDDAALLQRAVREEIRWTITLPAEGQIG